MSDAIKEFLESTSLDEKLVQYSIKNHWEELAGERISSHTRNVFFTKEGNLVIEFDSDAARYEATFIQSELMEKINRYAGKNIVKQIIFR